LNNQQAIVFGKIGAFMSALEKMAFSSIDNFLDHLSHHAGDLESKTFFRKMVVPGIIDPSEYLKPYRDWSKSTNESWNEYINSLSPDIVINKAYEEKLGKCRAYLEWMEKIISKNQRQKEKIINGFVKKVCFSDQITQIA
jgi:hypothetical protein